ncbi:MAG: hypothetical protein Q4A06_01085 [Cardiobacteriaceae bacterium]|nr:hypothetical protein [Cardiobacteriaceae bacterium]
MKVLILMPETSRRFSSALYASLRMRVGTCDVYRLDEEQWESIEDFFRRFVPKDQYDRIVLSASPEYLLKKRRFFREIPGLVVLCMDYDKVRRPQIARLFAKMPWIRWIGIDDEACAEFVRHGWDASWVPPAYDPEWFHAGRPVRETPVVHVFDPSGTLDVPWQDVDPAGQIRVEQVLLAGSDQYLSEHVKPQDIFLFYPESEHYEPTLAVHAMASGAVVLLPTLNLKRRVLYGWHDRQDCVFFGNVEALPELLDKLLQDNALREKISQNAVEKIKLFHPRDVGQRLGACLEPALRNPRDYPAPRRIFGIELGW